MFLGAFRFFDSLFLFLTVDVFGFLESVCSVSLRNRW